MSAIWESANWTRQFGIRQTGNRQFGMLPSRHVKVMSNAGVGPPFPLFVKKNNILFFSFTEEIKFNTWGLFNLPICPVRGPGPLR